MNYFSGVSLAALIGLLCIPAFALAAETRVGEQPSFPIDAVLADDLYMAGGNVTSAGAIEGDLVSAGGTVLVSGNVSADVIAAGGTVMILGAVGDDLRVGGGTITVQSAIADDVLLGGGQITLAGGGVGGDAIIGGRTVRIEAPVGGNVQAGGGEVYINAPVAGNVSVHAEKVTLGPQANIQGNFSYSSPSEVTLEDGAVVAGETFYKESSSARRSAAFGLLAFLSLAFLIKFVAIFISALILALVFKRYAQELVARAHAEPWRHLGWGLVFMIILPVISIALLITLIGIPFGVIGLLTFVISMIFAAILAPIVIGAVVHKWIWKPETYQISWRTILLGTFVYFLLKLIPFLGSLVLLGVMLIALGVAINIKKEVIQEWR